MSEEADAEIQEVTESDVSEVKADPKEDEAAESAEINNATETQSEEKEGESSGNPEEPTSALTEENVQSSFDDKARDPKWSSSRWVEHYESIDDEKPAEEFDKIQDPNKLILWAAEKNELETLRELLEKDSNLVNARDNDLYTPLHRASYNNNIECIKMLLTYDADISAKTADGWEPLHCACKWDSVEAVSLLLQNGADVNAQTKGHITPLHLAASNVSGRRTLELLLWQPYIDPNVKNDAGDAAYDIAVRSGPLGALFEILEKSVNVY